MITSHARREKRAIDKATAKITRPLSKRLRAFLFASAKHTTTSRRNGGREREGGENTGKGMPQNSKRKAQGKAYRAREMQTE